MSINSNDAPFNNKVKLECECAACESKYKILYFEEETPGDMRFCPFCGDPAEEYAETNSVEIENPSEETLYTDDEDALFESDIRDDDDYGDDLDDDGERKA